jgi:hypothetical protein
MKSRSLPVVLVLAFLTTATVGFAAGEYVFPRSFILGPGDNVLKYNESTYELSTDIALEVVFTYLGNDVYRVTFRNRHPGDNTGPDKEIFLMIRGNRQVIYDGPAPALETDVQYTNETGYSEP